MSAGGWPAAITSRVAFRYTNRRVSRLNPRDKWITQDDPNMRIVDDALWEAVKAQQDSLACRKGPRRQMGT